MFWVNHSFSRAATNYQVVEIRLHAIHTVSEARETFSALSLCCFCYTTNSSESLAKTDALMLCSIKLPLTEPGVRELALSV